MNAVTKHFRTIVGDGAELQRLFAGLATGERIEVTQGQYLPQHWAAVKRLADWLNSQTGYLHGVKDAQTEIHG